MRMAPEKLAPRAPAGPWAGGAHGIRPERPDGWPDTVMGELALRVGTRTGRSVATSQYHSGALRIMRPLYLDASGQACYVMINPGGGYVTGDDYLVDVEVEAGASLLLTTQAATKIYRTPGLPVRQHTGARVGRAAVLESFPDQVIAYRDADYVQTSAVEVDPEGTYIAAEVVTPGWAPDGSPFGYRRIVLRTVISRPGDPLPFLIDALILEPSAGDVAGLGGLDAHTHVGTLLVVDPRVDADLVDDVSAMADRAEGLLVGVSLAPGPALALRILGDQTPAITDLLLDVDAMLRRRWFDQDRIEFRKQ